MPNTSGQYVNAAGRTLIIDGADRFRLDRHFFLCLDDGLQGKFGQPSVVQVEIDGKPKRLWVEQRAKDQFGLVPIDVDPEATYSNRFISLDTVGLSTSEDWSGAAVWHVEP